MVETIGLDWKIIDEYVDRIKSITAEQVREVARKYLIEDRKTVVTLDPLPIASPSNSFDSKQMVEVAR